MKKSPYILFLLPVFTFFYFHANAGRLWQILPGPANSQPTLENYIRYSLDETSLRAQMASLSTDAGQAQLIELPLPDGSSRYFRVWKSSILPPALAAKYPQISTSTAVAIDNPSITAKLDLTPQGLHAIIFNGKDISFIDPDNSGPSGSYTVHYKKNERRLAADRPACLTGQQISRQGKTGDVYNKKSKRVSNGSQLRTYRLALSCDHQYAQAATGLAIPTIAQVLGKIVTSLNRINGVYERELSITMVFTEHEDTLIWPTETGSINGTDPFGSIDNIAYQCITTNQLFCDSLIGNANYDIGHVFTTGAGGLSQLGNVCSTGLKAQSVTGQPYPAGDGFDIDYVAHEMGHEFDADHPFNNNMDGNCAGNINPPTAYEPGSGSTIMAYAGICSPDDLQSHSDAYFHSISLQQIQNFITTDGDKCALKSPVNNRPVTLPAFTATYTIPYKTPFELAAPAATASVADSSITYCWEQWNLGDVGMELANTHVAGPIFRSFFPAVSPLRIFPIDSMVLAGVLSNAGTEGDEGEKSPDAARYLTFKLTVRDIYQGTGCFLIPDDSIHLDVINTDKGFTVTSQKSSGIIYSGGSLQIVTWDVAMTNSAPVNTNDVDIYLSPDGGRTWTYFLGTFPNNGSAQVTIPLADSSIHAARIKVKGAGNVFFNVNSAAFEITPKVNLNIFPIPANNMLTITTGVTAPLQLVIYNTIGQRVWHGDVSGQLQLFVSAWARGTYFLHSNDTLHNLMVRKFLLW